MNKIIDMTTFFDKVSYCCCFEDSISTERSNISGRIVVFNQILPPGIKIETRPEAEEFIVIYKDYRNHLLKHYMDKYYSFAQHYKDYRALKKDKLYSFAELEEVYWNSISPVLFLYQTMFDYFRENSFDPRYSKPGVQDLHGRVIHKMYLACIYALNSARLFPCELEIQDEKDMLM